MPHVHIDLRAGRDPATLRELIRNVTRTVSETLGAPPDSVHVILTEVPATHWGHGDLTLAEKSAQQAAEAAGEGAS